MAYRGQGTLPALNRAQVAEALERYSNGETQTSIAQSYGVCAATISHVVTGKYTSLEDRLEAKEKASLGDYVTHCVKFPRGDIAALNVMVTHKIRTQHEDVTVSDVVREAVSFYLAAHRFAETVERSR